MSGDHDRYPYAPIVDRAPFAWPESARIALLVVLNVEHFSFDRPTSDRAWNGPRPDVDAFAQRDYGVRVGFWRLLEILARHEIRVTVALNSDVCARYPQILRAAGELAWEFAGHGRTNSETLEGFEIDEERSLIREALETIEGHTGKRPRGWLSPRVTESANTLDLLAEAGVEYVLDWSADELPFSIRTSNGPLLALPYSREINDLPAMVRHNHSARDFHDMICDQFDVLHTEGGRVMAISLHPFVTGHPFRAVWLDRALGHIRAAGGTWSATGAELATWFARRE